MADRFWERFFRLVVSHRWLTLLLVLGFCGWAVWICRNLRSDFSVEQYFRIDDPERVSFERFRKNFPNDDAGVSLFWWDEALTPAVVADMRRAAGAFREAGLQDVLWIGNVRVAESVVENGEPALRIGPLIENSEDAAHIARRTEQFQNSRLLKNLFWNGTRKVWAIHGVLPRDLNTDLGRKQVEGTLTEKLAALEKPGRRLVLNGLPIFRSRFLKELTFEQGIYVPMAIVAMVAIFAVLLRSVWQGLLTLASVVPATLGTLAAMTLADAPLTGLTSYLPIVFFVVVIADTIHLVAGHRGRILQGLAPDQAVIPSFRELAWPCFLTSATTAIGMLSLLGTGIDVIVDMGIYGALGIMLGFVFSMLLLPAILPLIRIPSTPSRLDGVFARMMAVCERISKTRRTLVLGVVLAGCGLAAATVPRIPVNSYLFDGLRASHPLSQDLRAVEQEGGFGLFQLNVALEGDEPLHTPAGLRWMDQLGDFLRQQPEVVTAVSLADVLRHIRAGVMGTPEEATTLPATQDESSQLLLLAEMEKVPHLNDIYRQSENVGQVVAWVPDLGSQKMGGLFERVQGWMNAHPPPSGTAQISGTVKLAQNAFDLIVSGFTSSLASALLIIFCIFLFQLRSWRLALVAMVPNVVPMFFLAALLHLLGLPLEPYSVLVFTTVFGIDVDNTIHFLGTFKRKLSAGGKEISTLVDETMREVGLPASMTTVAMGMGFLCLAVSAFRPIHLTGLMVSAALLVGMFADIILMPALLRLGGGRWLESVGSPVTEPRPSA